ncbi:MAG TPA: sugar ABC transporter substrate-binding protein [Streptosporangiaceae bacterium]|nr:sugar ABC transporter substrate-binding protein [Streptosporangiaceae bacterium]
MKRLIPVCLIAGALAIAGCSSGATSSGLPPAAKGKVAIGQSAAGAQVQLSASQLAAVKKASKGKLIAIVCATMETQYHATLCNHAKALAQSLGFTAEIFDAQTDPNRELQGLQDFVSKGAYAILDDSLGGNAVVNEVKQAIHKGVVVVQLTSQEYGAFGAITVSVDDATIAKAEGEAAGTYAATHYAGQKVQLAVTNYPSIPDLVTRASNIVKAFESKDSHMHIVGEFLGGTPANGFASMQTALQKFPHIQGVVGINDAGNLGAYKALKNAGHNGSNTFIFGIDCDPQAVALIRQNTMYKGCVDTNPGGTGQIAARAVAEYLLGQTVPGNISVPVSVFQG